MSLSTPEKPAAPLYAGFWRRGAACFLDGLLLVIPGVLAGSKARWMCLRSRRW